MPAPRAVAHLPTEIPRNHKQNNVSAEAAPGSSTNSGQKPLLLSAWGRPVQPLTLSWRQRVFPLVQCFRQFFSNRTTAHAVFNSVGGTSFQPFVSAARLAMRIPTVIVRMTSLTTTLMMWLMFENHCLASRTRASNPPPRLPLLALHPPCCVPACHSMASGRTQDGATANITDHVPKHGYCNKFHRLVVSRSLVGSSKMSACKEESTWQETIPTCGWTGQWRDDATRKDEDRVWS